MGNREILFRGKKKFGVKEWLFGDLVRNNGDMHIFNDNSYNSHEWYRVEESTVGQFTGLLDKNGKKVFEGDVDSMLNEYVGWYGYRGCWALFKNGNAMSYPIDKDRLNIIGNIFDNPELINP